MVMLMGMALWLGIDRLLVADFWKGVGAVRGATAGCGAMASIGICGAEGVSVGVSLVWWQSFQRQMPTAKMQMAAPIMGDGEVNASR